MALGIRGFNRRKGGGGFEPFEQTFNYTGNIQNLIIPSKGLYLLEVYGAGSYNEGLVYGSDGLGGYSKGYVLLEKNDELDIAVGGSSSGYNGGSAIVLWWADDGTYHRYSSGGLTHIAKHNTNYTTLASYSNPTTASQYVYIAAGGGGCQSYPYGYGGSGGGNSGGNGTGSGGSSAGATQTAGNAFGQGASSTIRYGARQRCTGGGGGGWYGGRKGESTDGGGGAYYGGSGGSGWIGGVPQITYKGVVYSPSTENGVRGGNGQAKITRIA